MSTDRELLELAAKAAGIEGVYEDKRPYGPGIWRKEHGQLIRWNPLTGDGDALRLLVKLRIDICRPSDDSRLICAWDGGDFIEESLADDACAATRRAIVRAAAEIGKHSAPSDSGREG